MPKVKAVASFLNDLLKVDEFTDSSHNGLQVGGDWNVTKVCCGVDAALPFFEEAGRRGAELVICHHGLSWGDSLKRITGLNYRCVSHLVENGMALYAAHLPLDAHPHYGNNARLGRALGLVHLKKFAVYNGREIGFYGALPKPMQYESFKKLVGRVVGNEVRSMDFGKKTVRTVGVVSGAAAEEITDAAELGLDVYVSGEPRLGAYHLAQAHGINAVFGGHYATETFGVKALAGVLQRKFSLDAEFIDLGVPY